MLDSTINLLAIIESLEAELINLGLYHTQVTVDEVWQKVRQDAPQTSRADIERAFRQLMDEGQLIEWKPSRFRSKIAETVRLLRLVRFRLWKRPFLNAPLLVEDIRVEFRQRHRPKRDAVSVVKAIPEEVSSEVALAFKAALDFDSLSHFQAQAMREVFDCASQSNAENKSFIIAGDTGAGKTEAFLFPILLDIANEGPELRHKRGVRALFVYPRIRLARNQLGRILRYTTRFHKAGGPRITVGIQNGDVPRDKAAMMEQGWPSAKGGSWYRVELLETCVECGEGHYWLSANDPAIETGYPRLVCDRCAAMIENLLLTKSALTQNAPDLLIITDVSLSQWLTRQRYSHLWGLWQGERWVAPRFLVLDEVHLYERLRGAHIARLIKRFQARVRLVYRQIGHSYRHPIVIGVSATLHDEQRFLAKLMDVDPQDKTRYERLRIIKPNEGDLEPTQGRERYIFIYPRNLSPTPHTPQYRVNDQTVAIRIVMAAMHNLKTDAEWRGLAFFDSINDLRQFRHNYDADPSFAGRDIPSANQHELWRIRTDRQKQGHDGYPQSVPNHCGSTCEKRAHQATLHECAHFREGDCWLFAKLHGWNERLEVANSVYAGVASQLDGKDLIPTSPSLEVGYDDDGIQLIYQHKAPRSAASFIQRRGRAGRAPNDSPIIITLLWPYRRDDAFYFFHPEALYDPAFDDVPLNAGNFNVQRTHSLLAFFDLLACLRRQNVAGIANKADIYDFTEVGRHEFRPVPEVLHNAYWEDDPKRVGQKRLVIKHYESNKTSWISGKPIQKKWVRQEGSLLLMKGWLAMNNGLGTQALTSAYEALEKWLPMYLKLAEVASRPFRSHRSYPFFVAPAATSPKSLLHRFGNQEYHQLQDQYSHNWLATYRNIDWMLQGNEKATTLTIHYPNPNYWKAEAKKEPYERTLDVTFALTELLPGNVSYRLREDKVIHWTPVPRKGESTFLYPEEGLFDDAGNRTGTRPIRAYLPMPGDIPSKADSIFGVPAYLYDQFPGLPFMTLKRLRAETFGAPNRQYSNWYFIPDPANPKEGYAMRAKQDVVLPPNAFAISRRSSAGANSIIIPYIAASRKIEQRHFDSPLDALFGAIEGFLEEGAGMLGYTRVFYEMQIRIKARKHEQSLTLHRSFYPPKPQVDEAGEAKAVLVGYAVETQGIRFQLNPDLLAQTFDAILADDELRLWLRHHFAIYHMAPYAAKWELFIKTHLDWVSVAVDYWLQEVVPHSKAEPRLLDHKKDFAPLLTYYESHRLLRAEEVKEFEEFLSPTFFEALNQTLPIAFRESADFRDFVESVILHSLSALLKNLIARLGGVGSNDLVAYADMPILKQVDRSIAPRILIMDTVAGGSGGIAQAFERLDLTKNEGSLWWMLQTELGNCPIGNGEALVKAVLTRASARQIQEVQKEATSSALQSLLNTLDLSQPEPDAFRILARTLFRQTEVAGHLINPALIMRDLFLLQESLEAQVPGALSRTATIRQAVSTLQPTQPKVSQDEQPTSTSQQSPVTSHQSAVTSQQSYLSSEVRPVTSHQSYLSSEVRPVSSHTYPAKSGQSLREEAGIFTPFLTAFMSFLRLFMPFSQPDEPEHDSLPSERSKSPAREPLQDIASLRESLKNSGVAENELDHELGLQLLAIYNSACEDGCPICLSATSDIEHYYLAPLLNSRRVLKKLSEVLFSALPHGDCLVALEDPLLAKEAVQVKANPGRLAKRLDPSLGLGIVPTVDHNGQVRSGIAVVTEPKAAAEFLKDSHGWQKRWNKPEHKPYTTPSGLSVRSKAEYVIATKLEDADIGFEYEPRLAYRDKQGRTRFIHPDFYLYEHNLYVEYWGLDSSEYMASRQYKEQVYQQLAKSRQIRVLHLERGDDKHDRFMAKIRAEIERRDE